MIEVGYVLSLSVITPLIISVLSLFSGKKIGVLKLSVINALALSLPFFIVVVTYADGVLEEGIKDPIFYQHPSIGSFTFVLDPLNAPIVAGISVVTAIVALYSARYMTHRINEMVKGGERVPGMNVYFFLYTLFSLAMIGLAYSTNLVLFYLFLELTLVPSFLLIAYYGYGDRRRISLLYFVWTHVGAVLFLFAALAYGLVTGTFDFMNPVTGKPLIGYAEEALVPLGLVKIVFFAMILGLFIKMAVFGVHMWLPYAHAEAPTPISALLSPNLIGLAGYALARITYTLFPSMMSAYSEYLVILGFITIIYGGLVALRQDDFKRFLAYSSISQMGYILLGVATLTSAGIAGAMLHYFSHAIGKAILFLVAGVFITELHGLRSISKMGGLARVYPLTASAALIGFMHLAGMPPTFGLWSELFIVQGLTQTYMSLGQGVFILVASLMIVSFTLTAAYGFTAMKKIFYGELHEHVPKSNEKNILVISLLLLSLIGLLLFVYPRPLLSTLITYIADMYGV